MVPAKHCLLWVSLVLTAAAHSAEAVCPIEARLPEVPEILAVANADRRLIPVPEKGMVLVTGRDIRLKLSKAKSTAKVFIYLDGEQIPSHHFWDGKYATLCVTTDVPPGVYSLTARAAPYGCDDELASPPSKPVLIRYQPGPDEGYVWRNPSVAAEAYDEARESARRLEKKADDAQLDVDMWNWLLGDCELPKFGHGWHQAPIHSPWESARETFRWAASRAREAAEEARDAANRQKAKLATWETQPASDKAAEPDAFESLPVCDRIDPPGSQSDTNASEANACTSEEPDPPPPYSRHFRFLPPAHFPLRQFGLRDEVFDEEGAVIYEGMRFSWNSDGRYQVSFVVATPAVPTTLQLRFLVRNDEGPWQTVTLLPIRLNPGENGREKLKPEVCRVERSGYSAAIAKVEGDIEAIRREGTARFGFGAF